MVAESYSVGLVVHLELVSLEGARRSTAPVHLKQSIPTKRQINKQPHTVLTKTIGKREGKYRLVGDE